MSSTTAELLLKYQGHIVPRSFSPGFIALSYVVSLIGAACTLELLNRRTSHKGRFNHLLLVSSAVSMGGIAIWCMHFIGNRAMDLGDGEDQLQISYSSGFTALSFFVPIGVLLAAFVAIGTNNTVSWWRVGTGGVLAGAAICGMHYLGNNSIDNYICIYNPLNVAGSALIAVAASIVSLALFFVFRAAWTNTWWKRAACSVVLAGAVSGMHWCAATGTEYQLVSLSDGSNELSRNTTVIVVICLSICACTIMAFVAVYTARILRRYANKAQQVVLAAAVFDGQGRILVNPDGLMPSERVTDSFLEKNASDTFSVAHPLFHWMFRASRNWPSVSPLVDGMASHLGQIPRPAREKDAKAAAIELINENGEMISDYDVVLRELFCVAASGLAEKTKEPLASVGVLWDDILSTGRTSRISKDPSEKRRTRSRVSKLKSGDSPDDLAEKGMPRRRLHEWGRGSLMFLVRRVQSERDIAKLEAAGYRFADLRQVSGIIGSSMQVQCWDFEARLRSMAEYADNSGRLEPGVHLGFFGIRARVGSYGFDVLVRKNARSLLPSVQMPMASVEPWHMELLSQLDGMSVSKLAKRLEALKQLSTREMHFTSQLYDAVQVLRTWVDDPIFDDATLSSTLVSLPSQQQNQHPTGLEDSRRQVTVMIAFRLVIPIHIKVTSSKCEFIPLNFFKVHQLVGSDSLHQLAFAQSVHREFAPMAKSLPRVPEKVASPTQSRSGRHVSRRGSQQEPSLTSRLSRFGLSRGSHATDGDGNPIPTAIGRSSSPANSNESGSTLKLWTGRSDGDHDSAAGNSFDAPPPAYATQDGTKAASNYGGIMVSEEIRVEIHEVGDLTPMSGQHAGGGQRRGTRLMGRGATHRNSNVPHMGDVQRAMTVTSGEDRGAANSAIEMESLASNVHTGASLQVSNVEVDRSTDAPTFVDQLFAICIDSR